MRQHPMWSILAVLVALAAIAAAGDVQIDGALVGTGMSTYQCVSCWDGAFSALGANCL